MNYVAKDMNPKLKFLKQLITLFFGAGVLSFGIAMYIKANLGADPLTTFLVGLSKTLNINIGRASQVTMLVTLIIILIVDKKYVGVGTIVNAFLTGELLNLFMMMNLDKYDSLVSRIIILSIGVIAYGVGLSIIILAGLGQGSVDSIMSILKDKYNISIERARRILDLVLLIIGVGLGGSLGIGTLMGAFLNGPIMAWILKRFNKIV